MQVSDPGWDDPQAAAIHSASPGEARSSETLCTNGYDLSGAERWKDVGEGIVLGDCEAAWFRALELESFWEWEGLSKAGGREGEKNKSNY